MLISATVTPPYPAGQLPPVQSETTLSKLAKALADTGFDVLMVSEFGVIVRADQALFEKAFGVRPPLERQFSCAVKSQLPFLRDTVGRVEVSGRAVPLL